MNPLKFFCVLTMAISAAVFVGCGPQAPPPSKAMSEIKGTPINSPVPEKSDTAGVATTPPATATPAPVATNPGSATPASDTAATPTEKDGEYYNVGFDKLAGFTYEMPDESNVSNTNKIADSETKIVEAVTQKDQIPTTVRAFDKKPVALKGFMLPLKVEGGLITELLIMRDQSMCCYGSVPRINEWVSVKMTGKGLKPIMDQAVTLYGTLHVGEVRENGYLVGIYTLDGDKMAGPLDL
jgi:hypothetical protein